MNNAGFLEAILEHPDDEAVRLIYADFLDDHGQAERAEFIRIQCRLAHEYESCDNWATLADLYARETELLEKHGKNWSGLEGLKPPVAQYVFRRGFVEHLTLTADVFVKNAQHFSRLAPIRFFSISDANWNPSWPQGSKILENLAKARKLAYLTGLDCSSSSYPYQRVQRLQILLTSPHLTSLRRLNLSRNNLADDSVLQLAVSPGLGQLTTLDLSHNQISLQGVEVLLQSASLPRLHTLDLVGNYRLAREPLEKLARVQTDPTKAALLRNAAAQLHPFQQQPYVSRRMQRVRWQGGGQAARLIKLLGASSKDARIAAAEQLGLLGKNAVAAVPVLVQRLYDGIPLVGQAAGAALGRLARELPAKTLTWLRLLTPSGQTPEEILHTALQHPDLPDTVDREFGRLCQRRSIWRAWQGNSQPLATEPESASTMITWGQVVDVGEVIKSVLDLVEQAAERHAEPDENLVAVRRTARVREGAWLLGRLCGLLLQGSKA